MDRRALSCRRRHTSHRADRHQRAAQRPAQQHPGSRLRRGGRRRRVADGTGRARVLAAVCCCSAWCCRGLPADAPARAGPRRPRRRPDHAQDARRVPAGGGPSSWPGSWPARGAALPRAGPAPAQHELAGWRRRGAAAVTGPACSRGRRARGPVDPNTGQRRAGPPETRAGIHDRELRAVVNELWSAGAEAVAVNGLRVSPLSVIRVAGEAILLDLQPLNPVHGLGDRRPGRLPRFADRDAPAAQDHRGCTGSVPVRAAS